MALSAACAASAKPKTPTFKVIFGPAQDGHCKTRFDDDAENSAADLKSAAEQLHKLHPDASIDLRSNPDTPWECVGTAMTTISKAGFKRIRFLSQPDPSKR